MRSHFRLIDNPVASAEGGRGVCGNLDDVDLFRVWWWKGADVLLCGGCRTIPQHMDTDCHVAIRKAVGGHSELSDYM